MENNVIKQFENETTNTGHYKKEFTMKGEDLVSVIKTLGEITKQKEEEKQLLNNLKNIYNHWLTTDCDNLYKKDWEKMFCMYTEILKHKRDDEYNDEILLIIYNQIIEK